MGTFAIGVKDNGNTVFSIDVAPASLSITPAVSTISAAAFAVVAAMAAVPGVCAVGTTPLGPTIPLSATVSNVPVGLTIPSTSIPLLVAPSVTAIAGTALSLDTALLGVVMGTMAVTVNLFGPTIPALVLLGATTVSIGMPSAFFGSVLYVAPTYLDADIVGPKTTIRVDANITTATIFPRSPSAHFAVGPQAINVTVGLRPLVFSSDSVTVVVVPGVTSMAMEALGPLAIEGSVPQGSFFTVRVLSSARRAVRVLVY